MDGTACDLLLPCRDEAAALNVSLPRVPASYRVTVVDNCSSDGTDAGGRAQRAMDLVESRPGCGGAVHFPTTQAALAALVSGRAQ